MHKSFPCSYTQVAMLQVFVTDVFIMYNVKFHKLIDNPENPTQVG